MDVMGPSELKDKGFTRVFGPWRNGEKNDDRVHGVLKLALKKTSIHIYYATNKRTTFFYLVSSCCYDLYCVSRKSATDVLCRRCGKLQSGRYNSYFSNTPEPGKIDNSAIVEAWLVQGGLNVLEASLTADSVVEALLTFGSGTCVEEFKGDCDEEHHA